MQLVCVWGGIPTAQLTSSPIVQEAWALGRASRHRACDMTDPGFLYVRIASEKNSFLLFVNQEKVCLVIIK